MVNTLSLLALAVGAYAASHSVDVGSGGNVFNPSSLTAAMGDTVTFNFNGMHSVAQGDYSSPCSSSGSSEIYSGMMSSGSFSIKINSTDPIWYFCSYSHHCQEGMVGVINPPSSGDTLSTYKSKASSAGSSTNPSGLQNGILGAASGFGASSSSASSGSVSSTKSGSASSTSSGAASSGSAAASSASVSASSASVSASSASASATAKSSADNVKAFGLAGMAGVMAALMA